VKQKSECLEISNVRPNKAMKFAVRERVKMQRGLLIFLCKCFVDQSCCTNLNLSNGSKGSRSAILQQSNDANVIWKSEKKMFNSYEVVVGTLFRKGQRWLVRIPKRKRHIFTW